VSARRHPRAGYRLVESTLTIRQRLTVDQHASLLALLGRPQGSGYPNSDRLVLELAGDPAALAALDLVRHMGIAHDVTVQLRWTGPPRPS
jgi:hypothetical protein